MAAWLRWLLRQPAETDFVLHEDLDVSAIAYLNKGAGHAVSTAIANLASKHLLNHLPGTSKLASRGQLPEEYGMLERVIFAAASNPTGRSVSELRSAAGVALQQIKEDLMERGLLVPRDHLKRCIGLPLLLAIVVPLAGIVKILIGLSRDRPVAILVFLTIVAGIVMVVCFARSPRRSRAGAEVLHHFKDKYSQLRYQRVSEMSPPQDAALAVGLFGLSVLQGTSMANYYSTLNPVQWNSGSSGSDFGGSSCGGGGSSCGGGGGGGCGGCGGGGGN